MYSHNIILLGWNNTRL